MCEPLVLRAPVASRDENREFIQARREGALESNVLADLAQLLSQFRAAQVDIERATDGGCARHDSRAARSRDWTGHDRVGIGALRRSHLCEWDKSEPAHFFLRDCVSYEKRQANSK